MKLAETTDTQSPAEVARYLATLTDPMALSRVGRVYRLLHDIATERTLAILAYRRDEPHNAMRHDANALVYINALETP